MTQDPINLKAESILQIIDRINPLLFIKPDNYVEMFEYSCSLELALSLEVRFQDKHLEGINPCLIGDLRALGFIDDKPDLITPEDEIDELLKEAISLLEVLHWDLGKWQLSALLMLIKDLADANMEIVSSFLVAKLLMSVMDL